ncbi:BRCA1-associated protein-like [Haliotis rubra]|uniref:BRCA1-associated protein-like n=1 Tax=Haliotis rubra TaxID=36100 RepID=UPI001EE54907|nr:BRCA1-associated protein-like [Haliotis rubra]
MLIYMVVFRLEISDDFDFPKAFQHYSAPGYKERQDTAETKLSYASVLSTAAVTSSQEEATKFNSTEPIQAQVAEHRGLRVLDDITLESLEFKDILLAAADMEVIKQKSGKEKEKTPDIEPSPGPSKCLNDSTETPYKPVPSCDAKPVFERAGSARPKSHSPTSHMPSAIHFFSGNPCVEVTKGILHIYKDSERTSLDEGVARSEMICLLGVPASHTIHDLLMFAAPMSSSSTIEYMRIIRCSIPNQYMVLLKFTDQKSADEFYTHFNNRPFNSIEPDICHLVYVAKVEIMKESEGATLPVPGLLELPTCPVCLERMDESVDGVLTVLCNHSFHTSCLAKWGDTSCPVCRYSQTPEEVADNHCMKCGSNESLWICLICGHVGCGRYVGLHAYRHFQDTNHTYAMQLGNNRVWDYAGDNYVHRLVQNKSDGKLVEVDEGGNVVQDEKLDSLTLEYTYLLTTQLESQRQYFEEKMEETIKEAEERVLEAKERWKKVNFEREVLARQLTDINKEKQSLDKKCSHYHERLSKSLCQLKEEQQMNTCLRDNQQLWQNKVTALENKLKDSLAVKDKEVRDLQDQLRDIMFYLEAQQKLSNNTEVSQEEIQEGQVIVGAAAAQASPTGKRSRKKQR